ncbi:MAG: DUF1622 domain-containing protein [Gemmatimonadetes bacterium]|nr:DUF1622 domain-containing protein [Gemmatimonadota bacterium]
MVVVPFEEVEGGVEVAVQWLRLAVETMGAAVIALGIGVGAVLFVRSTFRGNGEGYTRTRLTLARYLAVALEFQLAADILSTAIAPTWDRIGRLGAIAVIRTGLNYFLAREMEGERLRVESGGGREPAR